MTREEIREGMEQIVSDMVYGVGAHYTSEEIVAKLQEFEDSQGVVLKMERELPKTNRRGFMASVINETIRKLNNAGYVAVEPLIKGE